jgi:deoxyribodipyrimidine photo-lyase
MKINIFWFRSDLRLDDNIGLNHALSSGLNVLPVYIFDTNITGELDHDDPRIRFVYETLSSINNELHNSGTSICILKGDPVKMWKELIKKFGINTVYINKEYEPYSIQRDNAIENMLTVHQISLLRFKDRTIFEEREILKSDHKPYTVFTPYKNKWLAKLDADQVLNKSSLPSRNQNFHKYNHRFPSMKDLGICESPMRIRPFDLSVIGNYDKHRDFPSADKTSYLSPHLRFGTVSIRKIVQLAIKENSVFSGELIWREFFMQILYNFPNVVTRNFNSKYDDIHWRNNEKEFERWCNGETGYPLVDAGIRQLNETGYMHNRVRMVTADFLCKHLLIDWRWGEAYFAGKLLDYDLASNNGNWQWTAGTGCDAVPYFRILNPNFQQKKFDSKNEYVNRWAPDTLKSGTNLQIVEHDFARKRAINIYREGIKMRLR